jgi:GNAT superfamily N-acetyltransferase
MLDPGRAELAFALIDEYQGQGIGTALISTIARGAGLQELIAEVLPENAAMLDVFKKSGLHPTIDKSVESSMSPYGVSANEVGLIAGAIGDRRTSNERKPPCRKP